MGKVNSLYSMKKEILIVDDEVSILKLLNFVLGKDYKLIIKNSGVEAISWLEEGNDPALIISDLHMPYFDGTSFIHNLKVSGYYRDIPVILLSGNDDLTSVANGMARKAEAYIHKPFNPEALKAEITKLLSQFQIHSN